MPAVLRASCFIRRYVCASPWIIVWISSRSTCLSCVADGYQLLIPSRLQGDIPYWHDKTTDTSPCGPPSVPSSRRPPAPTKIYVPSSAFTSPGYHHGNNTPRSPYSERPNFSASFALVPRNPPNLYIRLAHTNISPPRFRTTYRFHRLFISPLLNLIFPPLPTIYDRPFAFPLSPRISQTTVEPHPRLK